MINTIKATINLTNVCLDEVDLGNGVIYRGDDLATALEIKAPKNANAYVLLACITPNGRNLGPFNADSTTSTSTTTTYSFVLTKANGYNFAVGRTELIIYYCVVNTNSSISKKAIGSICVDVKKGVSVDDEATFIIGDTTDADAVLTDLNSKMDNLINQVASVSTQLSNKLDKVNNRVTLTNSGILFTSRVENGTDYSVQNQGASGIANKINSSTSENTDDRTATATTRTINSKTTTYSTEQQQTSNYIRLTATDGTNTKVLAIAPQSVNINGKDVVVEDDLTAEATARQGADTGLQNQINQLGLDLTAESTARSNTDTSLQSQIDAINAAQNLADIVADLTALNNYDTSVLETNDKVEVLSDSNHDNSATVYNWSGSEWQYIGKYGDSYSKAESDAKYVNLTGTQTISGSKTFTNATYWSIEDNSNRKAQINAYADYLYINYYKDSSLDNYVSKTINATNLYDKSEIFDYTNHNESHIEQYANNIKARVEDSNNSSIYSFEKIEKNEIELYTTNYSSDYIGYTKALLNGLEAYFYNSTKNYGYNTIGLKPYPYMENETQILEDGRNRDCSAILSLNQRFNMSVYYRDINNSIEVSRGTNGVVIDSTWETSTDVYHKLLVSYNNGLQHIQQDINDNFSISTIIDTSNASTELFMTDAEMDTLISEVFN